MSTPKTYGSLAAFIKPGTKVTIVRPGDTPSHSSHFTIREIVPEGVIVAYAGATTFTAFGPIPFPGSGSDESFIPWVSILSITPARS